MPPASTSAAFRALRNRNYRMYFIGQTVSMIGTWMQSTVQAWLVYRLSRSAEWLGLIAFAQQIPAFLASPFAGVLADRKDRRRILIGVQIVGMTQALLLALLVLSSKVALWQVAALSILLGLVTAFDLTTRHAFVVDMVGRDDLPNAIAWNSVIINGSRIVGPALAGILIARLGEGWCFLLNGVSYGAVIYGLLVMRFERPPRAPAAPHAHPLRQMLEAAQYVRGNRSLRNTLLLSAFLSFFGFPYLVLLPVFTKEILHGDASTLGWLTGATGVGAIVGAFGLSLSHTRVLTRTWISANIAMIGLSVGLLAVSRVPWLSITGTFGIGCFLMGLFPNLNTAIQRLVDDRMRGRVLSLYTMSFIGAAPLGSLLFGWLAERIGAPTVELAAAAIFLAMAASLHCFRRDK